MAKHKEMFLECNAESRGVYFKEDIVDFGFSPAAQKSEPKEITLVNTLNYDIKVYWVIPSLPGSSKVYFTAFTIRFRNYQVNPVSFEMSRQSEKSLKIVFNPGEPNVYYFHDLQCYAFRKTGNENK